MKNLIKSFQKLTGLVAFLKNQEAKDEPLNVMTDSVFKKMLTSDTDDSREALRSLLSACTHREVENVKILNSELTPDHLEGKIVRLDVNVTFNDGEAADLEMQMNNSGGNLRNRAVYYAALLLTNQPNKGRQYKDFKRVYQVFFLNDTMFPDSKKMPRRYRYMEEKEHDHLTELTEIIFYELPKLESRVQDYNEGKLEIKNLSDDEKWCIYMKYRHEARAQQLVKELCLKERGIMRAEKTVKKVSRKYIKGIREMYKIKREFDKQDREEAQKKAEEARKMAMEEIRTQGLAEGKAEGLAKGKAEGLAEGKAQGLSEKTFEIARKMKKAGLPPSEIEEFTGLSPKTIKNL